ncbi:glycosyltransferase [Paenibacillus sp. TSA_86.1]|uniref:glycosyltransferase n=1 Tax=Paenibacillus sp. TSA_86.1 TaxID=3415649 RepID=UPI0040456D12
MTKTISLCMIVKNEENVLERCLDSVREFVDEIIIVDTGSIDGTRDIARRYTDKIYSFEWIHDFSAARNESIGYAASDYILVLDADEYLESGHELQQDLQKELDYYVFNIKNTTDQGTTFNHTAIRLFRNNIELCYENRLHEHLNIIDKNFTSGIANGLIVHSGYGDFTKLEEKKVNRNLPLMKLEVKENPTGYNLFNMGKTYFGLQDYMKAVEFFKRAYSLSKDRIYLPELITKLAYALAEIGQIDEALNILKDATIIYPTETEMKYIQGVVYKKAGYDKDAEVCFLHCLELGDQGSTVTEGSGSFRAHLQLSELYEQDGYLNESYKEKIQAMEIKNSLEIIFDYLEFTLRMNQPAEEVIQNIEKFYKMDSIQDLQNLMNMLYGLRHPLLHHYLEKFKIAADAYISAVAMIYSKDRQLMKNVLDRTEDFTKEENGEDLLLLAYVFKDVNLLTQLQPLMNLGSKELKSIRMLIEGKALPGSISVSLEKVLFALCEKLIVIEEFDLFQELAEKLMELKQNYKITLSKLLKKYNFDELAIDVLTTLYNNKNNNIEVMQLLGDLCFRNNYLEDAAFFYNYLKENNPTYKNYERYFNLTKNSNSEFETMQVKREISKRYPAALWIANI